MDTIDLLTYLPAVTGVPLVVIYALFNGLIQGLPEPDHYPLPSPPTPLTVFLYMSNRVYLFIFRFCHAVGMNINVVRKEPGPSTKATVENLMQQIARLEAKLEYIAGEDAEPQRVRRIEHGPPAGPKE